MATFPSKVNYATGDILTATNMNDVGGAINLLQSAQIASGKNIFLNSDFSVWQRGTSITNAANAAYVCDRWYMYYDGTGATRTISQQTFAGDNPTGCNASYYMRFANSVAGSGATANGMFNKIENVRNFQNQTVTVSFYGKADASRTVTLTTYQEFGTGGSGAVSANVLTAALTTSWQRFTSTFAMPSVTGKTITANSSISHIINFPINATGTFDFTGFQIELASTASSFQTATGTIQGELAACQRYYYRNTPTSAYGWLGSGIAASTSSTSIAVPLPVTMRITPASVDFSTLTLVDAVTATAVSSLTIDANVSDAQFGVVTAGVAGVIVQYRPYYLRQNASAAGYIGFSAEL